MAPEISVQVQRFLLPMTLEGEPPHLTDPAAALQVPPDPLLLADYFNLS